MLKAIAASSRSRTRGADHGRKRQRSRPGRRPARRREHPAARPRYLATTSRRTCRSSRPPRSTSSAEVYPYVPDAWIDHAKTKIGYEIPFTRQFYVYTPPRPVAEIDAEIDGLEAQIQEWMKGLAR